jgi:hypothetical protein
MANYRPAIAAAMPSYASQPLRDAIKDVVRTQFTITTPPNLSSIVAANKHAIAETVRELTRTITLAYHVDFSSMLPRLPIEEMFTLGPLILDLDAGHSDVTIAPDTDAELQDFMSYVRTELERKGAKGDLAFSIAAASFLLAIAWIFMEAFGLFQPHG